MARRWFALALLCLVLALTAAGCAPRATTYLHENVDLGRMSRGAVLPFRNLSTDSGAAERVQSIFTTELLHAGLTVVEPGETIAALRELRLNTAEPLRPQQVVELGQRLHVDGIFSGLVIDHGVDASRRDRTYVVTAEFGLSETETGMLVWKSEVHGNGSSLWRKLFGGDSASLYAVSREVVRKALRTLF